MEPTEPSRAALRRYVPGAEPLLYLDNGSRVLERSHHDDTNVVRWSLREHGVTLDGPDPATLIDPVGADALRDDARHVLRVWSRRLVEDATELGEIWCQRFAVISHCRILHTIESGTVASKRAAAAWAKGRLDPRWRGLI